MKLIVEQEQGRVAVTIFRLSERINLGNTEELEKKAREAFENGARYLLLDLTNVPSITSAGLRTLQIIYRLFEQKGSTGGKAVEKSTRLKLLHPNEEIRKVLKMVGFDAFFDIYDTQEEAVKAF